LRLSDVKTLAAAYRREQMGWHAGAVAFALVTLSVLLLSAAGIYALMSVAVTRRRRDIGIRVALGADRGRILRSLFKRAFVQVVIGVVLGLAAAALIDAAADGELMGRKGLVILPAVAAFMLGVGLLATFSPARQALRINPIEALKAE
jgi:ABC-type antimicrobial peptide transport system permease subunit